MPAPLPLITTHHYQPAATVAIMTMIMTTQLAVNNTTQRFYSLINRTTQTRLRPACCFVCLYYTLLVITFDDRSINQVHIIRMMSSSHTFPTTPKPPFFFSPPVPPFDDHFYRSTLPPTSNFFQKKISHTLEAAYHEQNRKGEKNKNKRGNERKTRFFSHGNNNTLTFNH